ncbi:acetate/propionate family kinase [Gynuella sunshinyii]|uniref:Acetate kinase n=1 Tax=Gynuella sunshinyii YC6258 TaxID=1445510 RepID=A0A0C5VJ00_9GAMM|nr:acetate kinase [Gynuella sunshinyii]AJQ94647.1 acetate kinase [Gynuella sunshinyii YC6258]
MSQQVLVFNSGSSSFKFSIFNAESHDLLLSGIAERLGQVDAEITFKTQTSKTTKQIPSADHETAISTLCNSLADFGLSFEDVAVVGHRVVNGGEAFSDSIVVTPENLSKLEQYNDFAPLHNPAAVLGIKVISTLFPALPQVMVFDTAFHQTLAPKAYLYPIPYYLYKDHSIRRYGAHGTSHRYVVNEAVQQLGLDPNDHQVISAHLGNGCSAAAVINGHCVDTTMGLTPLEGLMMGTRSGDVDPSLHQFLAKKMSWSIEQITNMLNKESGLLGLSGISNDMRTLVEARDSGNQQAGLAIDVFCFRLARQIAGLAASLTRLDALIFTGGIGENSEPVRAQALKNLAILGFEAEPEYNQKNGKQSNGLITKADSTPAIVIQTNEELMIAMDCLRLTK